MTNRFTAAIALAVTVSACDDPEQDDDGFLDQETEERALSVTPNDPLFGLQKWHYDAIRVPEAWSLTKGASNVLVAVVDTGRTKHSDLDSKWTGGYSFTYGNANPSDAGTYHHGMHTAGTIGAVANNGEGGAGICWNCPLMPIAIYQSGIPEEDLDDTLMTTPIVIARAIRYAAGLPTGNLDKPELIVQASKRSDVINVSVGNRKQPCTDSYAKELQTTVDAAASAGSVVVVSAGNVIDGETNSSKYLWPSCKNVIVVTATDVNGNVEPYAVRGAGITLAAPGGSAVGGKDGYGELINCTDPTELRGTGKHGVVSTWSVAGANNPKCYRHWAGTSMAAPHVSGVVALMRSVNPALTVAQVRLILETTAKKNVPCVSAGECGAGVVDAYAAVSASTFDAAVINCATGLGQFTCGSSTIGGVPAFTRKWEGKTFAAINADKVTKVLTAGTCTPGKYSTVQLTVNDGIGRSVIRNKSFLCSGGPWN